LQPKNSEENVLEKLLCISGKSRLHEIR